MKISPWAWNSGARDGLTGFTGVENGLCSLPVLRAIAFDYTRTIPNPSPVGQLEYDTKALACLCRRWGIRQLALFGSAVRSDFGPTSDIDLLVELEPGAVLGFRVFELEAELSHLFGGRRIDLVSRKYLHLRLRERVLAEARVAYAA